MSLAGALKGGKRDNGLVIVALRSEVGLDETTVSVGASEFITLRFLRLPLPNAWATALAADSFSAIAGLLLQLRGKSDCDRKPDFGHSVGGITAGYNLEELE